MLKLFELFAGYGSQSLSLKRLDIPFENVGYCEIDKYAIQAHKALHGEDIPNYGDITKVDEETLPDMDMITYSFPCQDISVAGKGKGLSKDSGTRSSLLWECYRIIQAKRPKYLMMENVKNLVGKKNKPDFDVWLKELEELGYNNYWKVINAKDCGVPQNRERVFCVSILQEHDNGIFRFNAAFDNGIRLKDILEQEVDKKYYIANDRAEKLLGQINKYGNKMQEPSKANQGNYALNTREGKSTKWGDIMPALFSRDYKDPKVVTVLIDDTQGFDGVRTYENVCPTLRSQRSGLKTVVIPCTTPDIMIKNQNGRRFKTDGEPMFTLTGQDRHGILIGGMQKNQAIKTDGICTIYGIMQNEEDSVELISDNNAPSHDERSNGKNGVLQIGNILDAQSFGGNTQTGRVYSDLGVSPTLNTCGGGQREPKIMVKEATKKGYAEATIGDSINIQFPNSKTRRGRVGHGVAQTLETSCNQATLIKNYRIRKLTPKECFRLMGLTDEEIELIQAAGISNSQQYKMAGNSIVVDAMFFLKNIFYQAVGEKEEQIKFGGIA